MYSFSGPAEVRGRYQKLRDILHPILLVIFLGMPWIHIHGHPLFLFDVWDRQFIFFGFPFFSHDAPLLFFLVILLILSIFLVTALFGRLWCGWTCPQTVFIQGLFNRVEKWILGSYTKRIAWASGAESAAKKIKLLSVYAAFLFLSWVLSHSFVAYFLGSQVVMSSVFEGPSAHLSMFCILMVMTGVIFVNFTFFRENLCFYVCPYGRFQTALIDRNSLGVFYDSQRGEPRGKLQAKENNPKGACVDCRRCVTVCPSKIDIRKGFQLECISCGKCVDACNEVMLKLKRPMGLIRYETGNQKPITLKRFRLGLYSGLITVFIVALVWSLALRQPISFELTRSHPNPFGARIENGERWLQNQIVIHLKNRSDLIQHVEIALSPSDQEMGYRLLSPAVAVDLQPGQDLLTTAFLEIENRKFGSSRHQVVVHLKSQNTDIDVPFPFVKVD